MNRLIQYTAVSLMAAANIAVAAPEVLEMQSVPPDYIVARFAPTEMTTFCGDNARLVESIPGVIYSKIDFSCRTTLVVKSDVKLQGKQVNILSFSKGERGEEIPGIRKFTLTNNKIEKK